MSRLPHTYGPTCNLGPSVAFTGSKGDDEIPSLKAHYFYSSPQPIDDPLSVIPIPTGSDVKSANHPPRPFSAYDNKALEEAWVGVTSGKDKKSIFKRKSQSPSRKSVAGEHAVAAAGSISGAGAGLGTHTKNLTQAVATKHAELGGQVSSIVASKEPKKHKKGQSQSEDSTSAGASHAKKSGSSPSGNADETANATTTAETCDAGYEHPKSDPECHSSSAYCDELDNDQETGEEQGVTGGSDQADSSKKQSKQEKRSKASRKDKSSGQGDGEASEQPGNPYNPNCEDPHHVPMDSRIDACCEEFEKGNNADHAPCITAEGTTDASPSTEASQTRKDKSKAHKKLRGDEVRDAQGDAAADDEPVSVFGTLDGQDSRGDGAMRGQLTKTGNLSSGVRYEEPATENLPAQTETGTTGRPFVKMASRSPETSTAEDMETSMMTEGEPSTHSGNSSKRHQRESTDSETVQVPGCKAHKSNKPQAEVPVGVSRLHMVALPALQMKPIYWSPVHDIAAVTRGTWFYKDTMYPVEPPVANQLELGFRELRPWSQTWSDELTSALEVGAIGEEKIAHRLWPKEAKQQGKSRKTPEHTLYDDPYCAAKCFHGEAAAIGSIDPDETEKKPTEPKTATKKYSSAQVIYKDAQNAFILKPTLQPSAYYGRKPLAKIRKGVTVGIHVVRGFDWKLWDKLHPTKKTGTIAKAEQNAPVAGDADVSKGTACPACKAQEHRRKVTDLVLVIHGIGQKLSERMESFHFTHAINGFRRSINAELANDAVHKTLRPELGGVMVLPINWRSNLSFEDGGPKKDGDKEVEATDFTLKDITPDSIPAVRNIISDVMLDIPFYMSHHKPKMIRAAISEANRVYQLWCRNNPEFQQEGRVHLIAHSLGSAMALEILSKQPTVVPKIDPHVKKVNTKHLDFNTTNLFLCGSPAGFFLLLDKGRLIPRKAQGKPGADGHDDVDKAIVGEAGTFGCLAIDNIYNIMHVNDPIAYRLNATVDPQYAASLKNAQVPSATTGFFETIGNAVRSITPGVAGPQDLAIGQVQKPGVIRLPSQLEMEVHDFTREEIAEKKFYLINDCGQVDWFLTSGGGPLEIQYLNMLSAHSSYWGSPDFIRFIVIEVGRKPGRSNTLPNMRVVKVDRKDGKKV